MPKSGVISGVVLILNEEHNSGLDTFLSAKKCKADIFLISQKQYVPILIRSASASRFYWVPQHIVFCREIRKLSYRYPSYLSYVE